MVFTDDEGNGAGADDLLEEYGQGTISQFHISQGGSVKFTRREILRGGLAALGFFAHPVLSRFALASLGGYAGRPISSLGTKGKAIGTTWRV